MIMMYKIPANRVSYRPMSPYRHVQQPYYVIFIANTLCVSILGTSVTDLRGYSWADTTINGVWCLSRRFKCFWGDSVTIFGAGCAVIGHQMSLFGGCWNGSGCIWQASVLCFLENEVVGITVKKKMPFQHHALMGSIAVTLYLLLLQVHVKIQKSVYFQMNA